MSTITLDCPKCHSTDLEFECETQYSDDGVYPFAMLLEQNQQCDCEFSSEEIIALENKAADDFLESRGLEP